MKPVLAQYTLNYWQKGYTSALNINHSCPGLPQTCLVLHRKTIYTLDKFVGQETCLSYHLGL